MCVATRKLNSGLKTDSKYFFHYGRDIDDMEAEKRARRAYRLEYSGTPICGRSYKENSVGHIVVIIYEGVNSKRENSQFYGLGFGNSYASSLAEAKESLKTRAWNWSENKGYTVVESIEY